MYSTTGPPSSTRLPLIPPLSITVTVPYVGLREVKTSPTPYVTYVGSSVNIGVKSPPVVGGWAKASPDFGASF